MCGDFIITSSDGKVAVVGRSMEVVKLPFKPLMYFQNKGKQFIYGQNTTLRNKYAYTAIANGFEISNQPLQVVMDGMNERGLSCDLLFFPKFCEWPILAQKQNTNTDPHYVLCFNFVNYILGNYSNIDEIITAFKQKKIYVYADNKGIAQSFFTTHYQIFDRSGRGIIIEYSKSNEDLVISPLNKSNLTLNDKDEGCCLPFLGLANKIKDDGFNNLNIYESCGVMTNAPPYNYHLWNLNQYAHLTNMVAKDVENKENGQGGGMLGLPGDTTPPSRFIRIKIAKDNVEKEGMAQNIGDALKSACHILNSIDIVKGISKDANNTYDFTNWIIIKDLNNLKCYYRSYDDAGFKSYDFSAWIMTKPKDGDKIEDLSQYETVVAKWSDINDAYVTFK